LGELGDRCWRLAQEPDGVKPPDVERAAVGQR
jgi:hypothetical protein